ncbi:hypothetical protein Back2_20120 [Nocardioides baekrokdamisoli]|uniref:DUF4265 domain-containing protein n=1 Tax=Nocardioides baekrokdamisoli TaxID=1804624 RepID=A0A3G9INV8_9ACTN|nr:DUF4265 domain-containing protein [Nocardioides baekrokdamisoli]BBH17725.1 hypothetical protein Back2_20120 [Nocardioides baekrokdamisoli]
MADQFREHPSKTSRLVNGTLIPLTSALEANETVWFVLPTADGDEQVWEGLLAYRPSDIDRAEVRAIPLFAYDLNYGDEVAVISSDEGALVATDVVTDNGRYTFRVWLEDGDASVMRELVREFGEMGCSIEPYSDRLLGLGCERSAAQAVADALSAGEKAGRFVYETGRQQTR